MCIRDSVNDLVDNVTTESMQAGRCAAKYAMDALEAGERTVRAVPGENVRYLCPQNIVSGTHGEDKVTLFFRVLAPDKQVRIVARSGDRELASRKALRVNPGEMEHIQISAKDLSEDVVVEIQKEA